MEQSASLPFESVDDAVAWLDAHIDFEANMPRRRALPSLDRMRALTSLLGEPQNSIPSIHITGTNGKGSTTAMATMLLMAKGLSVGTYTSPNLHVVAERLARNGEAIDEEALTEIVTELALLESLLDERPTRFELLTAAALSWFATEAVDAMVVEVGLGGTWDCTNVVRGDVAVLTNVSFDHTDVLGPTLEGIAADKAGIIEPGSRVVVGDLAAGLLDIVNERAEAVGAASVWVYGRDFGLEANQVAVGGRLVSLWTPGGRYEDVLVPLHGAHQGKNAAVALAAVEAFFGDALGARRGRRRLCGGAGARPARGDGAPPPAPPRRRAQRGRHGRARRGTDRGVRRRRQDRGRCRDARWPRPVGHARATRGCRRLRDRRVRAHYSARDAGGCRGRGWARDSASRPTRSPTCATRSVLRGGMVDVDGLVLVAGSLYVVGTARADALASVVPWEDAGR